MVFEYGIWDDSSENSETLLNKMTVPHLKGSTMATLNPALFGLVKCVETGSGFILNHLYTSKADGLSFVDLSLLTPHTHVDASTGGGFTDMIIANNRTIETGHYYINYMRKADFTTVVSGTGVVTDITNHTDFLDKPVIQLETGATSLSGASIRSSTLRQSYDDNSYFNALVHIHEITNVTVNVGRGIENPTGALDDDNKYGFIYCSSVNGNWWVRTADGVDETDQDTLHAITANNMYTLFAESYPNAGPAKVDFYIDGGTVITKTDDVPNTGSGSGSNMMRYAIKNTAGANKMIHALAMRYSFTIYENEMWDKM